MRNVRRWMCAAAVPVVVLAGGVGLTGTAAALPDTGSVILPAGTDEAVTFESGGTVFHGSLRTPDVPATGAALLLPGSGPTDRNGNQTGVAADTLLRTADALAARGVASLRFDKIGAGATGLGTYTPETIGDYGFTEQVDHAAAAAELLAVRTGVGTADILVLGHSEGALTTLALADRGIGGGFALLQPLPMRYLDLLTVQFTALADSGQLGPDADAVRADLPRAVESLRTSGTVPTDLHPVLAQLGLNAANAKFLSEADRLDPPELAQRLAVDTQVLLTCSDKDTQVSCDQVEPLRAALAHTDLRFEHFRTANHALEELGPLPSSPVDTVALFPVSAEFAAAIDGWAAARG
ncbi:alpha/beta hydrolase [Rhodococcus sp. Z13]|uniref:Alpha/beta hydrolase n=1 Tax=Rhodococcus sacchari TaxID=2962047 RepID=A0ACD4DHJ4_9NOCA|nr:alpha/beta hydrolase [Rhodococcus sp. Z13]UYP19420.1 alpha/beta hydrolase [Rhodococcus sp. Z13]